jgi:pilus assembly protein CpaF
LLSTSNAYGAADTRNPDYQALKGRVHTELLNRLNLDRLSTVRREEAEPELRTLIASILEREQQKMPLSLAERESLVVDVLHELFGLGPLEALLVDPTISSW